VSTYRSVLRNREFRAMLAAHIATMLAMIVADVALTVLVYQRTSSPLLAALTFAIGFVPMGIGGVLFGEVGRTRPSRDVLVACEAAVAVLVAAMTTPGLPVVAILAMLAVKGTIDPIFNGVRAASLPELLGDAGFPLGRSLLRVIAQNAQLVGFAIGGAALVVVTPVQALLASAVAHGVAAAILLLGTRRRPPAFRPAGHGPLTGVRTLIAAPGMRPVLAIAWVPGFFAVAPEALAAPYAHELGGGPITVGILLAGLPVGAVLGELIVGARLSPARRVRLVVPLAAGAFVPMLGYGFGPSLPVTLGLLVLAGLGLSYAIGVDQIAIATVPGNARRRAFTLLGAGLMVTQGLGFVAAGAAAAWAPVRVVVPVFAGLGLVAVLAVGRALNRADRLRHIGLCLAS